MSNKSINNAFSILAIDGSDSEDDVNQSHESHESELTDTVQNEVNLEDNEDNKDNEDNEDNKDNEDNEESHDDTKDIQVNQVAEQEGTTDNGTEEVFEKKERRYKNKFEEGYKNKFEENLRDSREHREHREHREYRENQTVVRDEKLLDNKQIYDENKSYGEIGNDKKLNSYWTVWVHKINCPDWTLSGYQKIYVINSIGSFWRFFNNFQLLNTYQNQIFIMREEVAPIWEDVNNKFGGICSLKIDSIQRGMKTDLSTEVFNLISLLIMNETFIGQNKNINGISYSVKKRSSLIKIWTKTYSPEHDFSKDLPVPLMNKFNVEMQKQSKSLLTNDGKISIQYKQIKPEFE
jgi:hypothetical protein